MGRSVRSVLQVGWLLMLVGCYVHGTFISISPIDTARSFTPEEQDAAKAIAIRIGRAAGFWETDVAQKLSSHRSSSWPYVLFVSLGAPGGSVERRSISIAGEMRQDRREIRISVGDDARGEPPPDTRRMIEDLRAALEREFPGCSVEVTSRKKLHLLAP
jgi:hypothetical protein